MKVEATRPAVVVVGLGNTGSWAAVLAARIPDLRRIVLVDPDAYDESNVWTQNAVSAAVGRPKAQVAADALRALRPDLEVVPVVDDVERVPRGILAADAVLCNVDNRRARQVISQLCARLGMAMVDVAVGGDTSTLRVAVFRPDDEHACVECGMDANDYRLLEVTHGCGARANPPTGATSELGALAAGCQVMMLRRVLAVDQSVIGTQVFLDPMRPAAFAARMPRRLQCRFDHRRMHVDGLLPPAEDCTLAHVLTQSGDGAVGLDGFGFARDMACARCSYQRRIPPTLTRAVAGGPCPGCGAPLLPVGYSVVEAVSPDMLGVAADTTLAALGFHDDDVITVWHGDRAAHMQITGVRG